MVLQSQRREPDVRQPNPHPLPLPNQSNQVHSVWRSTLILSFVSCYLMWGMSSSPSLAPLETGSATSLTPGTAIVFMAQWHPLIAPKRADIRPDRVPN